MSIFNLENYFYINNNSLSKEICYDIINYFENEETGKYEGNTGGGLRKDIKDTLDFQIPAKNKNNKQHWNKIRDLLEKELNNNVKNYVKKINNAITINEENSDLKYKVFDKFVSFETIQIQRYTKQKGRYIYHQDFLTEWETKKYRVITFLWYLNDVEEGGETEFWGTYRVKPEAGKLLFFPATWTYPHRGIMPISNNKYIITGWIYLHDQ
jgi:hypothetical protein